MQATNIVQKVFAKSSTKNTQRDVEQIKIATIARELKAENIFFALVALAL